MLVDKGVREFVQASKLLRQRGFRTKYGCNGSQTDPLTHMVSQDELTKWSDEGVVELWGHRTDMPQVMAASQIIVLPSYYGEGLPKVLIEAAACGRAVITTDHTGCRDAIEPGITGLLVPVRDPISLANAIHKLLINPSSCYIMGRAGRKQQTAFDEGKWYQPI